MKIYEEDNWDEHGELPPVGVECEYRYMRSNTACAGTCKILSYDGDYVWFKPTCAKHVTMKIYDVDFSAKQSDRDKLVEQVFQVIYEKDDYRDAAEALIDASWRPIKQQSEDEFANYAKENCGYLPAFSENSYRTMYRAGCRFIDIK